MALLRPVKCCWFCTHAKWKTDKRGRRQAQYVGECQCPIPPLPQCYGTSSSYGEMRKHNISDTSGTVCATFIELDKRR